MGLSEVLGASIWMNIRIRDDAKKRNKVGERGNPALGSADLQRGAASAASVVESACLKHAPCCMGNHSFSI